MNLPVYFARNARLYREFRPTVLAPDDDASRIAAAVRKSLAGDAADPDYRSLWPPTVTVRSVTVQGTQVTVDLGDVGPAPPAGGPPDLAVQQLVYTVAAAATYTSIKRADGVRLLIDGRPAASLWGTDISGSLHQAPMVDVQAPVWVIEPAQGAQVGKTFTVYLAGIVFEGTVTLRIRDATGTLLHEQVVQLSAGAPALGEARVTLQLPAGHYAVEAYYVAMKDGTAQWVDDHDFTVG
ncbi:Gmad2 immunoglobulin-like domain-containing protein [Dactylosporangium sp. CA-092794]|uniref:Gmad2 immunoglobulin-like domain-containing protein n=1 Tax=Dactylosporangium sp. CA-092794 TaxID=3239929 RepID=UPI003D907C9D